MPAAIRKNGRRLYDPAILAQLRLIRAAQEMGHTLAEIKTLSNDHTNHAHFTLKWRKQATNKIAEIDEKIHTLQQAKARLTTSLECACTSLTDCIILADD